MTEFDNLEALSVHLRQRLADKKYLLLFAYNSTGKTRLSGAFKEAGKQGGAADTLYFNAFTEDLFTWDNDLDEDQVRFMTVNTKSKFFAGLEDLEMETRIRRILSRYADFNFDIDLKFNEVSKKEEMFRVRFSREVVEGNTTIKYENIKISRGEESIFVWSFFLAIAELAVDEGIEAYNWVRYIYVDDPISSLDEGNAISVANHIGQIFKKYNGTIRFVFSTHHPLFFNVLHNEFRKAESYYLSRNKTRSHYMLTEQKSDTPLFQHVALVSDVYKAAQKGELHAYHFNALRSILEKSASFHGYNDISPLFKIDDDDGEASLQKRVIDLLSHGNYSLFDLRSMLPENQEHFRAVLDSFLSRYAFNPKLFFEENGEASA